ncbi:MAG: substrate-binding domain-containing protein [Polyangiaceae bacterium]|nr:substrate-binding domain-containing protein [Polyangiaceae bacterium]
MRLSSAIALCASTLAVLALGCSSNSSEPKKEIVRKEMAESPFRPSDLESTINGLVDELTDVEPDDSKLGLIVKDTGTYWAPVMVGANRALAELELDGAVEGTPDDPDADVATDNQVAMFKKRRTGGYGGIGLAPLRDTLNDEVNAAVKAGIPVVTIDSDLADSKRQLYVGTNNAEAGKTGGKTLAKLLAKKTEGTVIIYGYPETDWAGGYERTMGAKEALEDAGFAATVYKVGWAEADIAAALEDIPQLIEDADPPVVGMIGMFSNAFRCAEVAENMKYDPGEIKIVAFDFEPDTLSYMDKGYIQATHAQRQYYMGYMVPYTLYSINVLGLDKTIDLLAEQMIDDERFDTGVDVVKADQVDDYNEFLDSLGIGG